MEVTMKLSEEQKVRKFKTGAQAVNRRKGAIKRLEQQLKEGTKPFKGSHEVSITLTEKDVERIKKELKILKSRV